MRKLLCVLLALLMIISVTGVVPFTASAAESDNYIAGENSGVTGDCEWELDEYGNLTISGEGETASYSEEDTAPWGNKINRVIVEDGVTGIGSCAFFDCAELNEVELPVSLTKIESSAFMNCGSLEYINIPENVESISPQTFRGCEMLSEIDLPDCVQTIGEEAFKDCYSLSNFRLPADCSEIGDKAFNCCPELKRIKILQSVCEIGFHAFGYDYDDDEEDDVPVEGFTIYGYGDTAAQEYAEENDFAFEELGLTSGTTGECTWNYEEETSTLTISGNGETGAYDNYIPAPWSDFYVNSLIIEDGVTWIRSYNFGGLDIESVVFPDSVTQIGMIAFMDCESLSSVTLPSKLETIGGGAFSNCKSLESVDLPEGLWRIGPFAFSDCSSLSDISFPGSLYDLGAGVFDGTSWRGSQPDGAVYAGKVLLGYKGDPDEPFTLEIADGTVSVAAGAFSGMWHPEKITDIKFPSSLFLINVNSFWDCSGLTRVEIPSTVTHIEHGGIGYGFDEATEQTVKNTNLVIVGETGSEAERYADEEGFRFFDPSVTSGTTGDCTWNYDSETLTLTISGNGATAPYDEDSPAPWAGFEIKNLVIEDGVTWIRSYNFGGLDIESVVIPDSVTQIGIIAFMDCESLSSVTLPSKLETIGGGAFSNCKSLESVDLPEGLWSIGPFAFRDCSSLSDISFPDSLYDLGAGVFDGTSWRGSQPDGAVYAGKVLLGYKGDPDEPFTLEIADGTVSVAAGAFSGMWHPEKITDIKFPSSLFLINVNSFWDCSGLTRVEIPSTVTHIEHGGIGYGFDEATEQTVKNTNLVIVGETGSEAERYADEEGFTFIPNGESNVIIGDVNGDKVVDILDATMIQKYAVEKLSLTEAQQNAADVNDDNVVDILDATDIQKFTVDKITVFKKKA